MMHKTWNVRDQTVEELYTRAMGLYAEIRKDYKLLQKLSSIQDAQTILNQIYDKKAWAAEIELELMRRRAFDGTTE